MKKADKLVLLSLFMLLFVFSSCSKNTTSNKATHGLKSIMASTSMIADVVKNISGDKASVESLIKEGQSPHNYEPSPRDVARLSSVELVFVNGFALEEGLLDVIRNNASGDVIEVSQNVIPLASEGGHDHEDDNDHEEDHDHEDYHDHEDNHDHEANHDHEEGSASEHHDHGEIDPHTWTSPLNVMKWCEVILKALEKTDPDNSLYYQTQYTAYIKKLQGLDSSIREALATLGHKPVMITDHRFMDYFARDYGVEIPLTISESFSSSSEPSPQVMARLIDYIKSHNIKAIFLGNTSDNSIRKIAEAIKREMNYPLKIETLLSGSLTPGDQEGSDYLSFMEYNVKRIVETLK